MIDQIERIMPVMKQPTVGDTRASCTYAACAFIVEYVDYLSSSCQDSSVTSPAFAEEWQALAEDGVMEHLIDAAQAIHDGTPTKAQETA